MALDPLHIALWRFEQIAPLLELCLTRTERSTLIDQMASRPIQWPSGKDAPVNRSTLYLWLKRYQADPHIESLLPAARSPHPALEPAVKPQWVQYALALIEEEPARSLYILCRRIATQFGLSNPPAPSSLHRALSRERRYVVIRRKDGAKRRTRFVARNVHQIWHGDAKSDFTVTFTNGTKRKVRILSLLDDCSRYILSARIVDSESLSATVATFHHAASRYGLPFSFYADRGSPYDSYLFRQGLAVLGIRRINTKPRNPSAHGKIEAYHRSLHRWFIKELPHQPLRDIVHLQKLLDAAIDKLYHQHVNRELKKTPTAAFNNAQSNRMVSLRRLHEAFLERHSLTPERKTGMVRLRGTLFRVPAEYLVPRRSLRFAVDLINPGTAYLIDSSQKHIKLEPGVRIVRPPQITTNEPLPVGSLSPLLETYRGRTLQRPVPGFGLPEIYALLTNALQRQIPAAEHEATMIVSWLRKYGPFQPADFTAALAAVVKRIGCGRPLISILEELSIHIDSKGG